MKSTLLAGLAALCAMPAYAQEMRTITDHSGYEVTYPVAPQRIVSLHDWTTTVMAHELGANLIGSSGRLDNDGNYFIRSARELYGLGFDQIELASVHGDLDMERIATLKPDLIITNVGDTLEYRDQLAQIAPTIMFEPMNGRPPMENYAEFADWLGEGDRFNELKAAYDARIAETKGRFTIDGRAPSYIAIMPNMESGEIRVFRNYGAQSTVLEDLGFTHGAIMDEVPEGRQDANFSPEIVGRLDTDYIFMTHITDRGETRESLMAQLDEIAPGYRDFVPAAQADRFVSMSRFHVYPTTFAAMNYVLEQLDTLQ
ncbi:periplasmic binding protein [Ketogulonicigenium robustum]|uniref:Periplasmic binding protein n=1 Tax=Ketogulonicigenium robustum TaxID=92947 RepID=A0A1W6NZI0_9RHOB|nr:ABC transporter substrate-binding protein [Ketogulonicigenium robustum]ARO14614.1 periplasmic binding protein [Ketogulonicigenium robustum]